ncbi:MAG: NHL repeat-containing protein [bacterium]
MKAAAGVTHDGFFAFFHMTPFMNHFRCICWSILCVSLVASVTHAVASQNGRDFVLKFLYSFPQQPIRDLPLVDPQAIANDPEGNIFVVDTGNNRILQFDDNGKFIYSIGGFGFGSQQFDRPLDISAKNGLDIFIADYNNERVERYDKNLNHISSFYSDEALSRTLQFGFPLSVDISKHGELFISDNENNRILKVDSFGTPEQSFGGFNWGDGQLEYPVKLDLTSRDMVYVSDQGTDQIVVFDYYGNFIAQFGQGVLNNPNGLAWKNNEILFVADSGNNRIAVFDNNHKPIFFWGEQGQQIGAFNNPVDVAIYDHRIFVLDSGNQRVQVFELNEVLQNDE